MVIEEGNSLLVDLSVSSLEDEFSDVLSGGVAEGDVGFNSSDHIDGGLIDSDEDSVVELSQPEQSEDTKNLGVEFVDTSDPHDECESGLGSDVD